MEQQPKKYAEDIINTSAHTWQTQSVSNLAAALAQFHAKLSGVSLKKDGESYNNKYLTLDNILAKIRPILAEFGLSVLQYLAGEDLATVILHASGEQMAVLTPFQSIQDNKRSNLQNVGAGMTYLRRYALSAALCISVDVDDDGQTTEQINKPNPENLPLIPYNRKAYDKAALAILKDGSLAEVEKKVYIPYNVEVTLYKLALEMAQTAPEAEAIEN